MGYRYGHRYDVVFHFNPPKKSIKLAKVKAPSIALALAAAHDRLLAGRIIATSGYYQGKLPRSVTVSRLGNQLRKKKSTSATA